MSVVSSADRVEPARDAAERGPLLLWMIFTGLTVFAAVVLARYGYFQLMVASDRTYSSSVVAVLYLGTCCHCFWRTRAIARE
ncbi:MAG: biopolymer transporter ExbB, partial [Bradyrhizobium sp.]|nr:biopolymer transporter ExbB [Bradyrhizobium sp.]